MIYSDTTNLKGIIQEEERLTGLGYAAISGSTQNLKEFTSINNIVNHRVWHNIFKFSGNWQYDDGNYTNLPSATTDIVSGTSVFAAPSEALTIKRIEIKDSTGEWLTLYPITLEEMGTESETLTDSGTPRYYRLINNTIKVYPTPDYNSTDGFKPFFDRDSYDFSTTDTTKTPGFASPYHSIIAVGGALEWMKIHIPNSGQIMHLKEDYAKLEKGIQEFYGMRFKDKKPKVGRRRVSFK